MSEILFTYMRNLPEDKTGLPNALLFASKEKFTDDQMDALLNDQEVAKLFQPGKPRFVVRYHKEEDPRFKFEAEERLAITTLPYYIFPLNEMTMHVTVRYQETDGADGVLMVDDKPVVKTLNYAELMDNCVELYRIHSCEGCSKPGLECVKQQVGHRPWMFTFSFNRASKWETGMSDTGTLVERNEKNKAHNFVLASLDEVDKVVSKMKPIGAVFRTPDQTKLLASPRLELPLRPGREHRFFKMKDAT